MARVVEERFGGEVPSDIDQLDSLPGVGRKTGNVVRSVAFGLPKDEAVKAVTINAAQILGIDAQTGSISEGKFANIMLTDGDPLEHATKVKQLFIAGKPVELKSKHTDLYEKFIKRP